MHELYFFPESEKKPECTVLTKGLFKTVLPQWLETQLYSSCISQVQLFPQEDMEMKTFLQLLSLFFWKVFQKAL